jgi:hypothetical protein
MLNMPGFKPQVAGSLEREAYCSLRWQRARGSEGCPGCHSFLMTEVERLTLAVSFGFTRRQTPGRRASEMRELSSELPKSPE